MVRIRPGSSGVHRDGCHAEELEHLMREAMEFHVEGMRLHGDPVPEPTVEAGLVEVAI